MALINIKSLLEIINPSPKLLMWITVTAVAAIPTVWLLSGKIAAKRVMDDTRLNNLELAITELKTSVDGLHGKFDEAETRFNATYTKGVAEVGEIIKESDQNQTEQLKFVIENWTTENRQLISNALQLQQDSNEAELNQRIDSAKDVPTEEIAPQQYNGDAIAVPLDDDGNEIYSKNDVSSQEISALQKNYKIISHTLLPNGNYNIMYRKYTARERESLDLR